MSTPTGYHASVLLQEVIDALVPPGVADRDAGEWFIDATLGDGGYSIEIIKRGGKVVGIDVDPQALERVQQRFASLGIDRSKYILIQGNFRDLENLILKQTETVDRKIQGVVFDLGVSSLQLEAPERGFSFTREGKLDMRMDPTLQVRALDLVNALNKGELSELFIKFGEEKLARQLAGAVVSARQVAAIETTAELAQIVSGVYGKLRIKTHGVNPATRVFQALRIAVNDELNALQEGLTGALNLTQNYGHILVISFHSLEDRIVKNTFTQWQTQGFGQILTDKPIEASEAEVLVNPRSRSAKLRVFEKGNL